MSFKSKLLAIANRLLRKVNKKIVNYDSKAFISLVPGTLVEFPENFRVGKNCSFGGNVRVFNTEMVTIGDECMVANGTQIITATHDSNIHPMRRIRIDRPIKIGNHVWIGTNALILPGVIVGDYAVIGAGAVITAHVPERAVVVGNPARIINFRTITNLNYEEPYEETVQKMGFLSSNKITKRKID